jgi:hypothetical protein
MRLELSARSLHPEAVSEILTIAEGGQVDKFVAEHEPVEAVVFVPAAREDGES